MTGGAGHTAWPLFGHGKAERDFLEARESDRLHHGWMISGPSGIGKSVLARRMAAFMLGAQCAEGTMDAPGDDPVVRKIIAEAHPDLRWLSRRPDEKGKLKQDITVDAVRELNEFFALKAGLGGWRVGVIDSIDELNRSGANAILKTLEEPPERCLLLLISHGSRPVLPTIRSRCRILRLGALDDGDTRAVLDQSDHEKARESTTLKLARGRPGHGLTLASPAGIAASNAARNFLRGLPKPTDGALSDVLSKGGADDVAFQATCDEMLAWLASEAEARPELARGWLETARLISSARELNMDRTQTVATLVSGLQKAVQPR